MLRFPFPTSYLALACLAIVASSASAQTERKTVTGSSIAIYNIAGKVSVEPGTGSDVIVEITRGGSGGSRLSIEVGDVRGRNALRVMYPDGDIVYPALGRWSNSSFSVGRDGTWGNERGNWGSGRRIRVRGSGGGVEAWADLRILVPQGKHVEVNLGVGELGVSRVNADLRLDVASARVTVAGTKGNLWVDAGSGGLDVRDANGDEITLETGSGGVTVHGLSGRRLKFDTGSGGLSGGSINADELNVDVGSGSIRLDDVKASRAKFDAGSGGIQIGLSTPIRSLDVDAGSGGVTIFLPASLGAEVDIETGSGGIDTDFPVQVTRMERHHLRGTIGDGAGRIRIESGSGSVRLKKG
jgi:hypothetical protein